MSGSVSRGKNDPSQSLQMIERPLMTPDEHKSMPKGQFVVMKTGAYPMKVRLKLYFKWGITFDEEYSVEEKGNRGVAYAEKQEIMDGIIQKYHPDWMACGDIQANALPAGGQNRTAAGRGERHRAGKTNSGMLWTAPRNGSVKPAGGEVGEEMENTDGRW